MPKEMNAQMSVVGDATSFLSSERRQHSAQMFTEWKGTNTQARRSSGREKRGATFGQDSAQEAARRERPQIETCREHRGE